MMKSLAPRFSSRLIRFSSALDELVLLGSIVITTSSSNSVSESSQYFGDSSESSPPSN